jgi:MFS family permease
MRKKVLEEKLVKARKISIKEGAAYSVSEGFGLRYITPYSLALGANTTHIGIINSVPPLLGNLLQLLTLKSMEKTSRKKIVLTGVFLQALMWLMLILVGAMFFYFDLENKLALLLLIFVYSLLMIFGASLSPAWNSWMRDIIPKRFGKYFGKRNEITGFVALASMLSAGFILDYFKQTKVFIGFAIIFLIAFLGRTISGTFLAKQYEPKFQPKKRYYFSIFQFMKKMLYNNFGRFVFFVSLVIFATAIASPFFAVYMLRDLHFSYVAFTLVTVSSFVSRILFMPFWGKFSDTYGNLSILKICGIFTTIIPFLWFGSTLMKEHPYVLLAYLVLIESFSGLVWAGFDLAAINFIYDAVTKERMALCIAYYNILINFGLFFGAMLGGLLSTKYAVIFGMSSILFVMLFSGIMRFSVYISMISKIHEVRPVKKAGINKTRKEMVKYIMHPLLKYLR